MPDPIHPLDLKGMPILPGVVVTICGDTDFTDCQGIVIDTASSKLPEDGPIAIFFDKEVPYHYFNIQHGEDWKGGLPTIENYLRCPRVICFQPHEVRVVSQFSIENIVKRDFGTNYHSLSTLKFPLIRNTHLCHMEECTTGLMATNRTVINVWGGLYVVYTCAPCHEKWHRARCDDFRTKNPLPGGKQTTKPKDRVAVTA